MEIQRQLLRAAPVMNRAVVALADSRWGGFLRGSITTISYIGRRSGKTISLPIGYRRAGDEITISISMPDAKSWWRNFLGDGAPLTIELDGADRSAHAVAHRDEQGRVSVTAHLDPAVS
jgi:hypothetical protein